MKCFRAEDLDTSSSDGDGLNDDHDDSDSSSSTDQDGQPGGPRISEKAREVLNKPRPNASYHFTRDWIQRQYGQATTPTFTQRQSSSIDIVSRQETDDSLATCF